MCLRVSPSGCGAHPGAEGGGYEYSQRLGARSGVKFGARLRRARPVAMTTFDAIVIGAGIVGAGAASALSRARRRVALLDAGPVGTAPGAGEGASRASFAWINATAKTDWEDYHRLNAGGVERYRALAREFGEARLGLHPTGMIAWADPGDAARRQMLRRQCARLREWGSPVTPLDEGGLRALEPHVAFSRGAEGFLACGDAWLDVPRAVDLLCEQVRLAGGTVHTGGRAQGPARALAAHGEQRRGAEQGRTGEPGWVAGLVRDEAGAVGGVELAGGARLAAPVVVVAVGPDTERSLRAWLRPGEIGSRPFLSRRPGLLIDTPSTGPFRLVRHVLYTGDNALHLRPNPSGGLLIGSEDADPESEAPDDLPRRTRALLARARAIVPSLEDGAPLDALAAECAVRIGVRPVPADDRTIIGPVPGVRGLYVIATHSGVTLGPYLGQLAAAEITGGTMPAELAPFRFDRFAG